MSHFTTVRTKITNAEILKSSLADLGFKVETDCILRGYNGLTRQEEIVAVLDGQFDLGWHRNQDGSFSMIGDFWGISKKYNQTELVNKINQKYAINETLLKAATQAGLKSASVNVNVLVPA